MKITIASAVLAGLALAEHLNELNLQGDTVLQEKLGTLAASLAHVMDAVEKVDTAVGLVGAAAQRDDLLTVVKGVSVIKAVTAELVSDQDKIMEAMLSPEDIMIMQLLQALEAAGAR